MKIARKIVISLILLMVGSYTLYPLEISWTKEAHSSRINMILFSSDGNKIYTCSNDSTVKIWKAEDGELIKIMKMGNPVSSIALSKDNNLLIVSTIGTEPVSAGFEVYDLSNNSLIKSFNHDDLYERKAEFGRMTRCFSSVAAFFGNDNRIISGSGGDLFAGGGSAVGGAIMINNLSDTTREFASCSEIDRIVVSNETNKIYLSASDYYANSASYGGFYGGSAFVIETDENLKFNTIASFDYPLDGPKKISNLSLKSENNLIVFSNSERMYLRDMKEKTLVQKFWGYNSEFSFNGKYLINLMNNSINLYDFNSKVTSDSFAFATANPCRLITVSSDNIHFATDSNSTFLTLWNAEILSSVEEKIYPNQFEIEVFPNPATDFLEISAGANGIRSEQIKIYDIMGVEKSASFSITEKSQVSEKLRIDVSDFPSGLYFLKICNVNQTNLIKIFVSH